MRETHGSRFLLLGVLALATACSSESTPTATEPDLSVTSIELRAPSAPVLVGQSARLTFVPRNAAGQDLSSNRASCVRWTSSDTTIATVDAEGVVTGVLGGDVTIVGTCDGVSASVAVEIHNPLPAVSSLSPTEVETGSDATTVVIVGTGFVRTTAVRLNGRPHTPSSVTPQELRLTIGASDFAVEGTIETSITNPAPGGGTAVVAVLRVTAPAVASIEVVALASPLAVGDTARLTAIPRGRNGQDLRLRRPGCVRWSSNDASVATIDSSGLVTAVHVGRAVMSATCESVSGTVSIQVDNPRPSIARLRPFFVEAGSGAFELVVEGERFARTSFVRWSGASRTTRFVSASELRADITAQDIAQQGSAIVTVSTPEPGGGVSGDALFPILDALATIAAGNGHTCAITAAGQGVCWGDMTWGQLGRGTTSGTPAPTPVAILGAHVLRSLAADLTHSCALTTSGRALCWGGNQEGQLGNGTIGGSNATPLAIEDTLVFSNIAAGLGHNCALTAAGATYCWGDNTVGQLGTGATGMVPRPVRTAGGHTFVSLASGYDHTCAVSTIGEAFCWGENFFGQLGMGTLQSSLTPVAVVTDIRFRSIVAGAHQTCGVSTDGDAWCWGAMHDRTPGSGGLSKNPSPIRVPGGRKFRSLATGGTHVCGIETSGAAYCWGSNVNGEMGNGSASLELATTPVAVDGGLRFRTMTAGAGHTCAIAMDGRAYCWGNNTRNQLGSHHLPYALSPVLVTAAFTFVVAAIGGNETALERGISGHAPARQARGGIPSRSSSRP